jgi:hypothetical protein
MAEETLDPDDWTAFRALSHRIVDEAVTYMQTVRERAAWTTPPPDVRARLRAPLPLTGEGALRTFEEFARSVLPYPTGNIHPRFWGWVIGTGTPFTALAELLAATMNCNVGDFDDAASLVEDQVLAWLKELMGFPQTAGALLVSGGSMANFVGLTVARDAKSGLDLPRLGLAAAPRPLTVYASRETHSSVTKAVQILGLGREALRLQPVDVRSLDYAAQHQLRLFNPAPELRRRARQWTAHNRSAFIAGYAEVAGFDPTGPLLTAFELEKAVYETVYETRNRPDWVDIPLRAVGRLVGQEADDDR